MRLARTRAPEAIQVLYDIMLDGSAAARDRIQAAIALLDRGCGKAVVPVYRGGTNLPIEMIEGGGADGEMTALINAAGQGPTGQYRKSLQDELARLDAQEREEREARRDQTDAAREAQARGEPISPLMKMLIAIKDETE
jgi:hypothetical protein